MKDLDPYDVVDTDELTYCWCHHRFEDTPEDPYRICGECHHVYATAEDLVDAYNLEGKIMAERWEQMLGPDVDAFGPPEIRHMTLDEAEHIGFCQFCLHDW